MSQTNVRRTTLWLTKTALMLAAAVTAQWAAVTLSGSNQLIVGSVVNFFLLFSCLLGGFWSAQAVACLTPCVGALVGLVPNPLLIPFVALSNAAMIGTFSLIWFAGQSPKGSKRILRLVAALVPAVLVKYGAMVLCARVGFPLVGIAGPQLDKLTAMWGITQMFTAAIGAGLALLAGLKKFPQYRR